MSAIGELLESKIKPATAMLTFPFTPSQMRAIALRNGCKYAEPLSAAKLARRNYMKDYMRTARANGEWKGVGKYIRKKALTTVSNRDLLNAQ